MKPNKPMEFDSDIVPNHIIALMKLETISKALRGEWKPDPENAQGYIPHFLLTEDNEINMDDVVPGLIFDRDFGLMMNLLDFRFLQRDKETADYFGEQFIDLWKGYLKF